MVLEHQNRLAREAIDASSVETLKIKVDKALSKKVEGVI